MNSLKLSNPVLLLAIVLVTVSTSISDAAAQSLNICSINYEGANNHKERYLQKHTRSELGQEINLTTLEKDVKNLSSLPSVGKADYHLDTLDNCIHVTYHLDEAITAFPIINFGLIEENFWFKLGFGSLNIAGLGHQASAEYQYNDNFHNYNIYYKTPYWGKSKWGNTLNIGKYASIEPLYFDEGAVNYDYKIQSYSLGVSYSFSPNNIIELSSTLFNEEYKHSSVQQFESLPGPKFLVEDKLLGKLNYQLKSLNYEYYKIDGWENQMNIQYVKNLDNGFDFISFTSQLKYFKTLGKSINLASRLRFGIASNNESPFAPFVLDSYVNIRGVGNRVDRGTAKLILNLEYRHSIFDMNKFLSQVVIFSDQGTWRQAGGELNELIKKDSYRHFLGGGLRLIYKKGYNYIFRIDYGVDILNSKDQGFVLGFGQYF